jgi:hypothetical protein
VISIPHPGSLGEAADGRRDIDPQVNFE